MANLFEDIRGVERLNEDLEVANQLRMAEGAARLGEDLVDFSNFSAATRGQEIIQAGEDAVDADQGAMAGQQAVTGLIGSDADDTVSADDFVDSLFPTADASADGAGGAEGAEATETLLTEGLKPGETSNCNNNLKSLIGASKEINQGERGALMRNAGERGALMRNAYVLKPLLKLDEASFTEIMIKDGRIDTELLGKLSEMKPSEMNAFLETFGKSSEAADASKLPYTDIRAILTNLPNDNPELYVDTVKNIREGLTAFPKADPRPTADPKGAGGRGGGKLDPDRQKPEVHGQNGQQKPMFTG